LGRREGPWEDVRGARTPRRAGSGARGEERSGAAQALAARRVLAWICCGVPLFDCAFLKISQLKCTE
jgi:hypothetical protein